MSVDPGTAMLGAAGISAVMGTGGALMANNASGAASNTSREAARRSVDVGTDQAVINSQLMSPYVGAGYNAMADIYGITKTGSGGTSSAPGGGFAVPVLSQTGDRWDSPTTVGYDYYGKTGAGIDPTGGAAQFKNALQGYAAGFKGYDPGGYLGKIENYGKNFTFDPNDPAFKYQMEEAEKSINKALAARGLYDSRVGVNALSDASREITAGEVDKQWERGYGTLKDAYGVASAEDERAYGRGRSDIMDLYNMSMQLGNTGYNKALDMVKVGTGAGASAGNLGNQSVNALQSGYGAMATAANQSGANNAALWSGLGAIPANALGAYAAYRNISTPTTTRTGW